MINAGTGTTSPATANRELGLYQLLDPAVLADPYPLFHRLQTESPVLWDPFLHAWVVTGYEDVMAVLHNYSAKRTPTGEQLATLGMEAFGPVAELMVRQMIYLDPPEHTRARTLAAKAFAGSRVVGLRGHIAEIVEQLLDAAGDSADRRGLASEHGLVAAQPHHFQSETVDQPADPKKGRRSMDVVADLAVPLPAIVSCEILGLPSEDWPQLTTWTRAFSELLGNFQHSLLRPESAKQTVDDMTSYFRQAIRDRTARVDGLLHSLVTAEVGGEMFSEDEVIANAVITLVGGLETTTNLIGNGMLALLRHPGQWTLLREDPSLVPSAVEEFLRFESPIQHTARIAPEDGELGGCDIRKGQPVIAVIAAANRDPKHFADPDRLDISRPDNRHLAFGWARHHCFGAPLARLESELAFLAILRRMGSASLATDEVRWRQNAGSFRGLESLLVEF